MPIHLKQQFIYSSIRPCACIHRLVGQAFKPNPMNQETINHKNENKRDNIVENLEWLSLVDNLLYSKDKLGRPRKLKIA